MYTHIFKSLSWSRTHRWKSTHTLSYSSVISTQTHHMSPRSTNRHVQPPGGLGLLSNHYPRTLASVTTALRPTARSGRPAHLSTHGSPSMRPGGLAPALHFAAVTQPRTGACSSWVLWDAPGWRHHCWFAHSPVGGHLGFQFGAIIKSLCTYMYFRLLIHVAKLLSWKGTAIYILAHRILPTSYPTEEYHCALIFGQVQDS